MTKTCTKCRIEKQLDLFSRIRKNEEKRRGVCKSCEKIINRERYYKNPTMQAFYNRWSAMKGRCKGTRSHSNERYAGRGIKIDKRWSDFKEFKKDMLESFMSSVNENGLKNTTLDRIDNDGNYCLKNCRWVDVKTQSRNRISNHLINFKGRVATMTEWAEITGIKRGTIWARLQVRKWSIEKSLTYKSNPLLS